MKCLIYLIFKTKKLIILILLFHIKSEYKIGKFYSKSKKIQNLTKISSKNKKNLAYQLDRTISMLGYSPYCVLAHDYKDYLSPKFHDTVKFFKKNILLKR